MINIIDRKTGWLKAVEVDDEEKRKRIAMAIRMREKDEEIKWYREHSKGYCPKCHMLIPICGKCDCDKE